MKRIFLIAIILFSAAWVFAGSSTPNLNLYKPSPKENNWSAPVNANWDMIDTDIADLYNKVGKTAFFTSNPRYSNNLQTIHTAASAVAGGFIVIDSQNVITSGTFTTSIPVVVQGGSLNNSYAIDFGAGFYNPLDTYCFKGSGAISGLKDARPEWFGTPGTSTVQLACNAIDPNNGTVHISAGTSWSPGSVTIPIYVTIVDESGAYPSRYVGSLDGEYRFLGTGANGSPSIALQNLQNTGNRSTGFVTRNGSSANSPRNDWFFLSGLYGNVTPNIYEDDFNIVAYQGLYYNTGTVSVTTGSTTVTGSGTGWTVDGKTHIGANFRVGNVQGVVQSVQSATSLTLYSAWTGSTLSGQSYTLKGGGAAGESGMGHYATRARIAADGTYIFNPSSGNLLFYDPITTSLNNYSYVFGQRSGIPSNYNFALIENEAPLGTNANPQVGLDFMISDTSHRRGLRYDYTTDSLSILNSDLTTTIFNIDKNGIIRNASMSANAELVQNGNMESASTGTWTNINSPTASGQSSAQKHSGSYSWMFSADSAYDGIGSQFLQTQVGHTYVVSAWVYGDGVHKASLHVYDGASRYFSPLSPGDLSGYAWPASWTYQSWVFTGGITHYTSQVILQAGSATTAGTFYLDDVSLQEVAAPITLPTFTNNAAAISGGLKAGQLYRVNSAVDPEPLYIVH